MAEDTNTTPDPATVPDTPEYNAAMAAKFRQMSGQTPDADTNTPDPDKPQRPAHIPEKFWDSEKGEVRVDDLAKSYAELERSRSTEPPKEGETGDDAAKKVVSDAGLDWNKVQGEVQETGKLSDDTLAALEKAGVPRAVAQAFVDMRAEVSAQLTAQAVQHVGGEENLNGLLKWAGDNLSDTEKVHFNGLLGSRDGWRTALDTLSTMRQGASKTAGEPNLVQGNPNRPSAPAGYRSRVEMVKDMGDARYQTDPAFRQEVARKMASASWDLDPRGGG